MPERAAQSTRADADAAATQDAQDAAQNANTAADEARTAIGRMLQMVRVTPKLVTLSIGKELKVSTRDVNFRGKTFEDAVVYLEYPQT